MKDGGGCGPQISGRRAFWAEETVGAKVLRQTYRSNSKMARVAGAEGRIQIV